MEPKPESLDRAAALFEQALSQHPANRAGFIRQICSDDSELRDMLGDMLAAHERQGDFLAQPTGPRGDSTSCSDRAHEPIAAVIHGAGTRIDNYTLIEKIGEGGFGEVWRARQDVPVQREVALKIIKLGMDTRQVIARFEAERQALAMMDHPNIARVLDAREHRLEPGVTLPFFVMELVRGVPITRFCETNRLTLRERLALFIDVCHAVQHAHQKGIIHRDLKPSNILVQDGVERCARHQPTSSLRLSVSSSLRPQPKIIDFGIAKAIAGVGPLTDRTIVTEARQLVGTPAYMSPEQAGLAERDIDTRSDIYSLGVLLYELLTGTTPFDADRLRRAEFDELRRIIREEEPPRPSTRLSSLWTAGTKGHGDSGTEFGPALSGPSSLRPSVPSSLRPSALSGDLDWIVMKCLEKDRSRRYETASGLAADIQRFLSGVPVLAAPPSRTYELRKLLRRHRVAVLTTTLVVSAMLVGLVGTLWQAARATEQRNRAVEAHERTLRVKGILDRVLTASHPLHNAIKGGSARASMKPDVKLIDVLDEIAPTLQGEFHDEPEVEADVRIALGRSYFGLSRFTKSRPQLEQALKLYRELFGPDDPRTLDCLHMLGFNYWWINAPEPAESAFRAAVAGFERRGDPRAPELIDARAGLAIFLYNYNGDAGATEAVGLAREVLALRRQFASEDSRDVFMAKTTLAHVLQADDHSLNEADALARQALQQCVAAPLSSAGPDEWFCRINALDCAAKLERSAEVEEHARILTRIADQIAGPDTLMATLARTRLANCLRGQRRWAEAEPVFRESLKSQMVVFGAENGHTLDTTNGLAECCFEQWLLDPQRTDLRDEAESLAKQVAAASVAAERRMRGVPDAELLIRIYEALHAAEPAGGFDQKAAFWRGEVAAQQGSSPPSTMPDGSERGPPGPLP